MNNKALNEKLTLLAALGGDAEIEALDLIVSERIRQMQVEGFSPKHDDEARRKGELAAAGACYLLAVHQRNVRFAQTGQMDVKPSSPLPAWPFSRVLWKPAGARRMVAKGATLALAELVRHIRSELP